MRSLDRKISHLVIDLKANKTAQDALRIKYVEFMGKQARKENVDHKSIVYETFSGYMEKDVPEVNKVTPILDKDKASRKWYSITSLYNYKTFYNVDPTTLEEGAKA